MFQQSISRVQDSIQPISSYSLTAQEEALAAEIGYQRQKPNMGKPEKNINYSEGDIWEMWQHAVAAGAEIAFARIMGLVNFVPSVNTYKSELDIPNIGEVRYSERGLRYTKRDNPDLIYILMSGGIAHKIRRSAPDYISPPYKFMGWMLGKDCMKPEWQYNDYTWYVSKEHLCDPYHSHIVRQ